MSTIFTVFGLLNLPSNITLYLDSLIDGMKLHRLSIDENESLAGLGAQSEEVSLRDDPRFRRTPDGRWIPATSSLANDLLHDQLSTSPLSVPDIIERLEEIEERIGVHTVFCPADSMPSMMTGSDSTTTPPPSGDRAARPVPADSGAAGVVGGAGAGRVAT